MKTAQIVLSLLLALPCQARNPFSAPPRIPNPGAFVHLTTRPWFTLDPATGSDAVSFIVTGNVYEPLIAFKSLKRIDDFVPFLASAVPSAKNGLLSKDGAIYSFPIRKNVRFHNGERLTPEDVRYSLLRFMIADEEGGESSLLLKPILGVYSTRDPNGNIDLDFAKAEKAVMVEKDNVIVRLKQPNAHFLKILASLPIIVSKEWAVAHGEWDGTQASWKSYNNRPMKASYLYEHMNGTGPFQLEKMDPGKLLVLKRNDRYWRKTARLNQVFLRVVPSKALRLWMLENGDADSSYLEDEDYAEAAQIPGIKIVDNVPSTDSGQVLFFTFDTDPKSDFIGSGKLDGSGVPPDFFQDRDVRRAFAYAFDYPSYLKLGMGMRGKRVSCLAPDSLLRAKQAPPYSYDPEKAKAEFRQAWGGKLWEKGFTLTIAYSRSDESRQVMAELLKASLEKINPRFVLRTKVLPSSELYPRAERHELPLFIAGYFADYPDLQSFAAGLVHSAGYFPKAQRYRNPEIDALVERADTVLDRKKRLGLYREIYRLANEDVPHVSTFEPTRFRAGRKWVKGLRDTQNVGNLNLNNFPYFYSLSKG